MLPPGARRFARALVAWFAAVGLGVAVAVAAAGTERAALAAGPRPQWRVGVETLALPLSDLGDDGRAIGYCVDLARELAREARVDLVLVAKPWGELVEEFRAGRLDVLAAAVATPERLEYMDFTEPHLVLGGTVFVRRGERVARLEELRGRRIGAMRQGPVWERFERAGFHAELVAIPHLREGLRQLAEGRIDAVPSTRMIGYKLLRDERLGEIEGAAFDVPGLEYRLCCAVHKGDAGRRAALDLALARVRTDGTYTRIHEQWLGPYEPPGWRWAELRPWLLGAAGLAVVAAGALLRQRRMLRRIAEQADQLRVNEERLRVVLEGSGAGSWDYDLVAGRTVRDARTASLLGLPLAELGTAPDAVTRRAHPDDVPAVQATLERLRRGDGAGEIEFRVADAAGRWRWVLVRGRVIARDAAGQAVRAAGTILDVTERRLAEQEQARDRARLHEAQRLESLGVLAGGVAHDFNNLLTVILGNTGLARLELGPAAQPFLAPIEDAATRAAELCGQMLAYAGRATVQRQPVDLSVVVAETRTLLAALAGPRARLHFDLPAAPLVADADRTQFRQVLMNFVLNAAEALPESGGEIRLATRAGVLDAAAVAALRPDCALAPGEYVVLEVRDSGRGIAPDAITRIFEPFYSTKFTGRGLGLAAALGIARAHGGTISVESTPGLGAVFRLWLPAIHSPAAAVGPTSPAAGGIAPPRITGEVLVVDDEAVVRNTLVRLLERTGVRATAVESGAAAIAAITAEPARFTVAVIDLTMPGLDGAQTLLRLRDLRPGLPALLVSGYSEEDVRERAAVGDGVAFLHKPFQLPALAEKLAGVLAAARG